MTHLLLIKANNFKNHKIYENMNKRQKKEFNERRYPMMTIYQELNSLLQHKGEVGPMLNKLNYLFPHRRDTLNMHHQTIGMKIHTKNKQQLKEYVEMYDIKSVYDSEFIDIRIY